MHQTKILPPAPRIRVTALGLMQRPDGRILVERGEDRSKNQIFYRALGGGVEFGEHAAEALAREFMEELGVAVTVNRLHRVIENIFEYEGRDGHEIIFVYGVTPQDSAFYAVENPPRVDKTTHSVCWRFIDEIAQENCPLYPLGFGDLVKN